MTKKIFIIILFFINLPYYIYSYSARSEIHKYGFVALANDISTISYNPAGLVYLPKAYAEFNITSDKNFKYNQLALGYYLTSFPLFSKKKWTSLNFSLGMTKIDENRDFSVGLGGTLIDFVKYGTLIKYNNNITAEKKYLDFNIGTIINIVEWFKIGFSAINIKNKEHTPRNFMAGGSYIPVQEFKFTLGANFDNKFKKLIDYSAGAEINIFNYYNILAGIQKNIIPFGLGFNFSFEPYKNSKKEKHTLSCYRENIFITCNYDKKRKKITKVIVNFNYKFHNFIYPPYVISGDKEKYMRRRYQEKKEEKIVEKDILEEQEERLEKAKMYFAEERLDDAKEEIAIILELNKNTKYAKEAQKLKREINRIEAKLKKLKKK